jgi:hypothetical protein
LSFVTVQHVEIVDILFAHSTDQAQPCDPGILGAMKSNASRIHPDADLLRQSKQVVRILGSAREGIVSHDSHEHHCLICQGDPEATTPVRHFDLLTGGGAAPASREKHRIRLS